MMAVDMLPLLTIGAITRPTRTSGRGTSSSILTPEAMPRFSCGTRSGIRPCVPA